MSVKREILYHRAGGPLSYAELATLRLLVMIVMIVISVALTAETATGCVAALAAYLVMDRVQVLLDWVREARHGD